MVSKSEGKPKRRTKKVKTPEIDLSSFEFTKSPNIILGIIDSLLYFIFKLGGIHGFMSPIQAREKSNRKTKKLIEYGQILGFSDEQSKNFLDTAVTRLKYYRAILIPIYLATSIGLIWIFNNLFFNSNGSATPTNNSAADISFLVILVTTSVFIILTLVIFNIIVIIGFKLASTITDRYFAEILCVVGSFYIVFELQQPDVLIFSWKKRRLLDRVDYLARKVLLLGISYSSGDAATRAWAQQHFRNIERYIREKEKIIIAPQKETLQKLRSDFYEMASVFVTGNYGAKVWEKDLPVTQEKQQTSLQRVINGFFRFIGIVAPIVIIAAMVMFPEQGNVLGLENKTVSLIALSWFLLTLDNILKLGVVEQVANLAKAIKGL